MLFALISVFIASSVTIDAIATGVEEGTTIEFLLVGPNSDRGYEAMFMTEETTDAIAQKFAKSGMRLGYPVSYPDCRFWPVGNELEVSPKLSDYVKDINDCETLDTIYIGLESPSTVFALYSMPQSILQLNDALDQSMTYGRFKAAKTIEKGTKVKFTFNVTDKRPIDFHADFTAENIASILLTLKSISSTNEVNVCHSFSPEMTIAEAIATASALQKIDSTVVKINGFKHGEFFYRAFLPLEKWRDRNERLTQPYEVKISNDKRTLTIIEEDWSDTAVLDPKLIITENADFKTLADRDDRVDTCFIYAAPSMKLSELYSLRAMMPERIVNWYIFEER